MKYKIEYISAFHTDVLSIEEYMTEYPGKAKRIFNKIDKALMNLEDMQEMYPVYHLMPDYRYINIEDYLVLYKVMKLIGVVEVHRLFLGGMDIPAHMGG